MTTIDRRTFLAAATTAMGASAVPSAVAADVTPPSTAEQAQPGTTPLAAPAFTPLPLGAVTPAGWLARQLRIQADGLTGHLDLFWPDVAQSQWFGGTAEGWERAPY